MTTSGTISSAENCEIAWLADGPEPADDGPCGLMWLGGFMSDMEGSKAEVLAAAGVEAGRSCVRFDYSGHGASGGAFRDGTISKWLGEAVRVFNQVAAGPRILVGSSMGGWLALLLARHAMANAPAGGSRVRGLVLIAPAADMTQDLMWDKYDDTVRNTVMQEGVYLEPSDYGDEPYAITRDLIVDGRNHLLLDDGMDVPFPVRILQGEDDPDVPWQHAMKTYQALRGSDVSLTLIKHGDHRLSVPENLATIRATCLELCALAD
jgi:pimeloyl-ACP methyl ester carboxylesterase